MNQPSATASVRSHLGYPGLLLGSAVLLATSLLALGHVATKEAIAERLKEDLQASLAQVVPAKLHSNDLLQASLEIGDDQAKPRRVYQAQQEDRVTGVAYRVTAPAGYGGPIELILGVARDGSLLGVRVLAHAETPGLGDKMDIAKSDWIRSFDGLSLENTPPKAWAVKKDGGRFDQFTGATITPRAVVKAVKQGLEFYAQHRERLLQVAKQQPTGPTNGSPNQANGNPASATPDPAAADGGNSDEQ